MASQKKPLHYPVLFSVVRALFLIAGPFVPRLFARWGIYLWGKTHRPAWRPWEIAIIDQAQSDTLEVEDQTIATYVWGEGTESILLAHGWNSRASHFKNYIEQLTSTGYRVIGFDAVGHGHSCGNWTSVIAYQAILKTMQAHFGPFHAVIGHSFGGFCLPHALTQGLQTDKAILIATPDTMKWLFERFTKILMAPQPVKQAMKLFVEKRFGSDFWDKYSVPENAGQLGHIPALILHDNDDPGVSVELAQNNHRAWPGSKLVITRELGHHRVLRHPSAVKPILEFIKAS